MIRKVSAHLQDVAFGGLGGWTVHLRCGHTIRLHAEDHSRKVKGRFCPACPGANRALGADDRNEKAREFLAKREKAQAISAELAAHLTDPVPA